MLSAQQLQDAYNQDSAPPPGTQSQGQQPFDRTSYISSLRSQYAPMTPTAQADTSFNGRVESDLSSRSKEAYGALTNPNISDFSKGFQAGGSTLGLATDVVGEGIKSIPGSEAIGSAVNDALIPKPIQAVQNFIMEKVGKPAWEAFAQKYPEAAGDLKALGEAAKFAGTAVGGKQVVEEAPVLIKQGAGAASDVFGNVASKVKDLATGTIGKIGESITGKALEDVLATPENQVAKLKPNERKAWFDNQKSQITNASNSTNEQLKSQLQKVDEGKTTMDKQIMQQHQANADAITKQGEDLQKELAKTSRDKVIELRPKILGAMQQQSQTYRQLVEEGMAGKESTVVDKSDLKDFVDNRFADDPVRAATIKERLGLTEKVDPMSTGKAGVDLRKPNTTLGEIYDQTKSLKQDLGSAARKGTRTFTSDEKLTDDAIHTLSSYMKGQGVDLSEANQFWSKYAPIRNQLVTEAKPFVQSGTNTKTFANTLLRVAKGTDVNNENFINEVENMVGEPITKEVRGVIEKLDANDKQAIANKLDTELQKAGNEEQTNRLRQPLEEAQTENKKSTEEAQQNLSDRKYGIQQKAAGREKIKGYVKTALLSLLTGTIGAEAVKHW